MLACRTWRCRPSVRAAACASLDWVSEPGLIGLTSTAMVVAAGTNSRMSSRRFGPSSPLNVTTPVRLPPGWLRLATNPSATGSRFTQSRNRRGRRLCCHRRRICAGDDHCHLLANQVGRQRRQSVVLAVRPAIFDRQVSTLDKPGFNQAPTESGCINLPCRIVSGPDQQRPDPADALTLLCPRRQRPRSRTAEQSDELPPPHSITSSARPRSVTGKVMPSVFAVLRLMTSSTFVDCWTGRTAGCSPLRMRLV